MEVYIGPADNPQAITPDFSTLQEWWDDGGTVKDLVSAEEISYVYLLPGDIDIAAGFTMGASGVTVSEDYYFHILGTPAFNFEGDFNGIIPNLTIVGTPTATVGIDCAVPYTQFSNFAITDAAFTNTIRSTAASGYNIIDGVGIKNIDSANVTSPSILQLTRGTIRNCIVIDSSSIQTPTSGNVDVTLNAISVTFGNVFNNLIHNISTGNNSSDAGANSDCRGILLGAGYAHNNILSNLSATATGGTATTTYIVTFPTLVASNNAADTDISSVDTDPQSITLSNEIKDATISTFNFHLRSNSSLTETGIIPDNSSPLGAWSADVLSVIDGGISFTNDIEGDTRDTLWSIGPDEFFVPAPDTLTVNKGLAVGTEDIFFCSSQVTNVETLVTTETVTRMRSVTINGAILPAATLCQQPKLRDKFFGS